MTSSPKTLNAKRRVKGIIQATKIDKVKDDFLVLAGHQLGTPLSAIGWSAESLLSEKFGALNPDQKKLADSIYKGFQRMADLVNSFLNISRLELGILSVEPQKVDSTQISHNILREFTREIKQKKLIFRENYQKGLPLISFDPIFLRIILQNLFSNAVKYTPEGGRIDIKITMERHKEGKAFSALLIRVTDTGVGIPLEEQAQVFQKFYRGTNAKMQHAQGTGLGLYMVKLILNSVQGKIWFESIERKGTTFYVRLPLSGIIKKKGDRKFIATNVYY